MFRVLLCCQKWVGSPAKSQQPNSGCVRKLDHQTPFGFFQCGQSSQPATHINVGGRWEITTLALWLNCNKPTWNTAKNLMLGWFPSVTSGVISWYRWEATNLGRICGAAEVVSVMVILPQTHLVTPNKTDPSWRISQLVCIHVHRFAHAGV